MINTSWSGLLDFNKIINEIGTPKGIIHLGAYIGEESNTYNQYGIDNVIWVEANPELIENLKIKANNPKNKIFCELLSDQDGVETDFKITYNTHNGTSQSSSVLDLHLHKVYHPHVTHSKTIKLKSKTLDTIFEENNLDGDQYDFMNIDLQGYELPALKGFLKGLKNIQYIYTEVNTDEVYKDCTLIEDLDRFLNDYGFERKHTQMTDWKWGEAFYSKNKIK